MNIAEQIEEVERLRPDAPIVVYDSRRLELCDEAKKRPGWTVEFVGRAGERVRLERIITPGGKVVKFVKREA